MRSPRPLALSLSLLAGLLLAAVPPPAAAQEISSDDLDGLPFRHVGPVGNRLISAAGVPGQPDLYYVGAASGGIWKTADGGVHWEPIFDDQPVHAIGALAVAPSDPAILWAGTGEHFIRSNVSHGNGVWKSTDGGETWEHMGLEGTGRISEVLVHPRDPDVVYAASLGHGFAPQEERGVYRTTNGGETWEKILFVDEDTGISDLVMDPDDPRTLFAGAWDLELHTWTRISGGPGSGLYVTRDGGDTWERLEGSGLPEGPIGKVGLCTTPADPDRIYALIETSDGIPWRGETSEGELWRSDDGGDAWELVSHSHDLAGRTAYYTRCAVSPDDPDEAYFLQADYVRSIDGGHTHETFGFGEGPTWDTHEMWIDPTDGDRMIVVGDGGLAISENRGETWYRNQPPVAQLYHVRVDDRVPYWIYTNRQDGPSLRGPSDSRTAGAFFGEGIPRGMWHTVGGGESGFATPDTVDENVVWSSTSGFGPVSGIVTRMDLRTRQFRNVEVWPEASIGWPAKDVRYRWQWTFPLLISPHDHETVYVGSQHVHRTTNGGQSWEVVSPDLTTADTTKMGISGGLTPDNIAVEYCCVVYAIDESPAREGVLWAGTNDGLVHVSRDGGESWTDVTDNIPGLPPEGVVRNIDASKWSAGKAYLTVDRHQAGDFAPYVYRTEDFGESWTRITDGIPGGPLSFVRHVREDPEREGLLFLGTENRMYVSFDDGGRWQPLQPIGAGEGERNLPPAPMYWSVIPPHFDDLVIGTYGRGIWILDDITPLQQLTPEVAASDVHLFEPRRAWRFRTAVTEMAMMDDQSAGRDPDYGASLNYWLGEATDDEVTLTITDADGEVVRTLDGTGNRGINRVTWDLETEPTTEMKLRTRPEGSDWVDLGDDRWRPAPEGRWSILLPPGTYGLTLRVGDEERSAELEVRKDPHSEGTLEDIDAQVATLRELYDDMNRAAEIVNRIEWIRRQLYDRVDMLESRGGTEDLVAAADSLDRRLRDLEGELIQLRLTSTGQDQIRWPMKLAGRIAYLAGSVASADFPPTEQALEVKGELERRLAEQEERFEALAEGAVAEFGDRLAERGLHGIVTDVP